MIKKYLDCYDLDSTIKSLKTFLNIDNIVLEHIIDDYRKAFVNNTSFPEVLSIILCK